MLTQALTLAVVLARAERPPQDPRPSVPRRWPSDAPFDRLSRRSATATLRPHSDDNINICAPRAVQGQAKPGGGSRVTTESAPPEGHVDVANMTWVEGWAKDPDCPSAAVMVQVTVDGTLWWRGKAGATRADVGPHAFGWLVDQVFGSSATNHTIQVVAYGVGPDGKPDGANAVLTGAGSQVKGSCAGVPSDCGPPHGTPAQEKCALGAWCSDVPCYWENRGAETLYVENNHVRVGVNTAFGGTVFGLHSVSTSTDDSGLQTTNYSQNLILEHGGAAVQLSIWGYDPIGPAAWFRRPTKEVPCDNTRFPSSAACSVNNHSCVARCCSDGTQVLDCTTELPCGKWTAGAPFNPIQAQGKDCGWDIHAGCTVVEWVGDANETLHTLQPSAFHFTSNASAAPLVMEQWASVGPGYANLTYRMTAPGYSGVAWGNTTQEVPAIFTSGGTSSKFFWYNGTAPFTNGPITELSSAPNGFLQFPDRPVWPHPTQAVGTVAEGWWGVCSEDESRCVTVAGNSELFAEAALSARADGYPSAYLTPIGYFSGLHPGLDLQWTLYLFPFKYDAQITPTQTVRDIIASLLRPEQTP